MSLSYMVGFSAVVGEINDKASGTLAILLIYIAACYFCWFCADMCGTKIKKYIIRSISVIPCFMLVSSVFHFKAISTSVLLMHGYSDAWATGLSYITVIAVVLSLGFPFLISKKLNQS